MMMESSKGLGFKVIACLLILLFFLPGEITASKKKKPDYRRWFETAEREFRKGHYQAALEILGWLKPLLDQKNEKQRKISGLLEKLKQKIRHILTAPAVEPGPAKPGNVKPPSGSKTPGVIPVEKKRKKIPVLLVLGGVVVVVGVVLYIILKSSSPDEPEPQTPELSADVSEITVPEGGTATFQVKLTAAPSSNVSVSVSPVDGDPDITVQSGSSLEFTSSNWNQNQTVTLAAAEDDNTTEDTATIRVNAAAMASVDVVAREQDNDSLTFVTSTGSLTVTEGQSAGFQVRLSHQPSSDVAVTVAWASGDVDISIQSGSSLTFTPQDWSQPQTVTLRAAADQDTLNGTAIFQISAPGLTAQSVFAVEQDDDVPAFQVDTGTLTVAEGGQGTFGVRLSHEPASTVQAAVSRISGDTDLYIQSGSSLTFNAGNWSSVQTVRIGAAEDSDTINGQAVFRVRAAGLSSVDVTAVESDNDTPVVSEPTIQITYPANGATVAGTLTVRVNISSDNPVDRVEFYVDGSYLAAKSTSPYEYSWDTTTVDRDGTHFLKAVVYDNTGATGEDQIWVTVQNN